MPEWSTISLFVVAASILVVMPGPNTFYIITRSVQQGLVAGCVSCLGVTVGTLIHVTTAALGVSALLLSSVLAFSIVKYLGAAYLIYLGIKTLLTQDKTPSGVEPIKEKSLGKTFYQGIVVNVLNPKTALFITAFLPQFVDEKLGSIATQIFFWGAVLVTIGTVSDLTYVLIAGRLGKWLRGSFSFQRIQRYFAGSVYIGLGVAAAFTGASKK